MKFKLGPFENARTFFSPKGNTTVIRDTVVTQVTPNPVETESTPPSGIPPVNEYEDRLAPTPEFLEPEPIQEKPISKRTPKKNA